MPDAEEATGRKFLKINLERQSLVSRAGEGESESIFCAHAFWSILYARKIMMRPEMGITEGYVAPLTIDLGEQVHPVGACSITAVGCQFSKLSLDYTEDKIMGELIKGGHRMFCLVSCSQMSVSAATAGLLTTRTLHRRTSQRSIDGADYRSARNGLTEDDGLGMSSYYGKVYAGIVTDNAAVYERV